MPGRMKALGKMLREVWPASICVSLALVLFLPQVGFSSETQDEGVSPQVSKTVPVQNEQESDSAPQVSQQVPLGVEEPQLVGIVSLGAPVGQGVAEDEDLTGADEKALSQSVHITFRISDEPTASWPDAQDGSDSSKKNTATEDRTVEVETGKSLGKLVPPTPITSNDELVFEGWQTEDFSHTYASDEMQTAVFNEDAVLYASFVGVPHASPNTTRATSGWTKSGTCEWQINASGTLIIRPENNASSGTLEWTPGPSSAPWFSQAPQIKSVVVQPGVRANYQQMYLFEGCSNMTSAVFTEGLGTDAANIGAMFKGCSSLVSVTFPLNFGPNVELAYSMFQDCSKLVSLSLPEGFLPNATNASSMFDGCSSLSSLTVPSSFGPKLLDVSSMFENCSNLSSLSVPSGFASNAETADYCFKNCTNLKSLALPQNFGAKATDMSELFSGCSSLSSLELPEGFGASITSAVKMFYGCSGLISFTIRGNFGVSLDNMAYMFSGCSSLSSLMLPEGFGSSARSMDGTFEECTSLKNIPDNFSFGHAAPYNYYQCFYADTYDSDNPLPTYYSGSDPNVYSYDWDSDNRVLNPTMSGTVVVEGNAFANQTLVATASELPQSVVPAYQWYAADAADGAKVEIAGATASTLDLSKLDAAQIVGKYLFCGVLDSSGQYAEAAFSEPTEPVGVACGLSGSCLWRIDHEGLFEIAPEDEYSSSGTLDELGFGAVPWAPWADRIVSATVGSYMYAGESLAYMFSGCTNMQSVSLSEEIGRSVTNCESMFAGCTSLTSVYLESGFGEQVTSATRMFQGCSKLPSLSLPAYFGQDIVNTSSMFEGCSSLSSLVLPDMFCMQATNLSSMFQGCSGLTSLSLPEGFGRSGSLTNASALFKGCTKLASLTLPDDFCRSAKNLSSMFEDCKSLVSLTLPDRFDERAEDASCMFKGCSSLTSLSVQYGFGGNEKTIASMFEGCKSLTSEMFASDGFGNFGRYVENVSALFRDCTSLVNARFSFYFFNATDASFMFQGCSNLTSFPLIGGLWEAVSMEAMFKGCSSLVEVKTADSFGLAVTDAAEMFAGCSSLTSFETPKGFSESIKDMSGMFKDCTKLAALTLSDGFTSSATNMTSLFANCPLLAKIPDTFSFGSTDEASRKNCFALGDPYSASNLRLTFYRGSDSRLTTYDWAGDNRLLNPPLTGAVKVAGSMYANQTVVATASSLPGGVTPAYQWYAADTPESAKVKIDGATSASLNLALVDSAKVVGKRLFCEVKDADGLYAASLWSAATDIVNMACGTSGDQVGGCTWTIDYKGVFVLAPVTGSLGTLGELAWNSVPWEAWSARITSAVVRPGVVAGKSLQSMFSGCVTMTSLDLTGLSTPQAADMLGMLSGCSSLKQLTGFNSLKSSRADQLFMGCRSLVSLDLGGFDTSNATGMADMFMNCSGLKSLDLSKLSTNKVTGLDSMFKGCSSLASLVLPNGFVGEACTTVASMFEGCSSLTTVPANFSFGPSGVTITTSRCFFVGDPHSAANLLSTVYLGDDERVAAYGWTESNRKLVEWNLKGEVTLTVPGDSWHQGRKATASVQFKAPASNLQPSYQWKRSAYADGSQAVDIVDATAATYVPVAADVGSYLVCVVSAPGTGAHGEIIAVSSQSVAAAQVSVTVPSVTSVVVSSSGAVSVPDASVYALGNPSGVNGSTGAIRLKSVTLTLREGGYPGGAWTLGTKADQSAYLSQATFAIDPGNAYKVIDTPSIPVGGTMPLQWTADLIAGGIGPQFARLLADAQVSGGAAYGSVMFTVEYAPEA